MASGLARQRLAPVTALVGALMLGCALTACSAAEPADERGARSDDVLTAALVADEPGCSAAAAVDGAVEWAGARGVADIVAQRPIDASTIFNIGSASKQFTAAALLMLLEHGEIDLDDPISKPLPELPSWAADVTIRDLMHHTSGLVDVGLPVEPGAADEVILDAIAGNPLIVDSPPGTFTYSNVNYVLLALIVGRLTGEPFAAWMADNVFDPLDLDMVLISDELPEGIATAYSAEGEAFVAHSAAGPVVAGPTGILTTPSELARWGDQYRSPRLIEPVTQEAALADAADVGDGAGYRYGPGIFLAPEAALRHGGVDGHVTAFDVSPDRSVTIAITCNRDDVDLDAMSADLMAIWSEP